MKGRAPRATACAVDVNSDRFALRHRVPAAQCTACAMQSHFGLRLFAAQPTPLGGHLIVERSKVERTQAADELVAERMPIRFRWKCRARSRGAFDEGRNTAGTLRFSKKHCEAVGKGREEVGKKPHHPIGRGIELEGQSGCRARELLLLRAAQIHLFATHATTTHAGLESLHVTAGDARRDCAPRESSAETAAAPFDRSR
ncbi:protein of unknown function [Burkholderia multivorans]